MLDNRCTKILLVILILFSPHTLFAQSQMKLACMSSWYERCYIVIDLRSKTLIRRTDNDYIMKITETRLRPENHIYISYEDNWSSGMMLISILNEAEGNSSYMDTLFTNSGGFVSTGFCKFQILE